MTFIWGPEQIESIKLIKDGVRPVKVIRPLEYENQGDIVLAVDTVYSTSQLNSIFIKKISYFMSNDKF